MTKTVLKGIFFSFLTIIAYWGFYLTVAAFKFKEVFFISINHMERIAVLLGIIHFFCYVKITKNFGVKDIFVYFLFMISWQILSVKCINLLFTGDGAFGMLLIVIYIFISLIVMGGLSIILFLIRKIMSFYKKRK